MTCDCILREDRAYLFKLATAPSADCWFWRRSRIYLSLSGERLTAADRFAVGAVLLIPVRSSVRLLVKRLSGADNRFRPRLLELKRAALIKLHPGE
jgi:hypothetical protein